MSGFKYAYATANISRHLAGEKVEIVPDSLKEPMTLPAKVH